MEIKKFLLMALFIAAITCKAEATVTQLPDPTTPIPGVPGETIASKHGDFWAYSAPLTDLVLHTTLGDRSTGTGHLDLLIYTGPQGSDNNTVQGGFIFQDPMRTSQGEPEPTFSGVWGNGSSAIHGPVYVDNILAYLHTFDPNLSIPIFSFDMEEPGADKKANLDMLGRVVIYDPATKTEIDSWSFDNNDNGQFDETGYVTALGTLELGSYSVNHNRGGGKLDFIGYAPTMDLSLAKYTNKGYLFLADFRLADLDGGGEELYLTGAYAPYKTAPEPLSIILLGSGLAGLALKRRKK